jgi:hypothetical protein
VDFLLERIAYDAALRALDKQETLVADMQSRAGMLLAASSVATSILAQTAFRGDVPVAVALVALGAFVASIAASMIVLLPREELKFSIAGPDLYERLFSARGDDAQIYRRLAYALDRIAVANNRPVDAMARAYRRGTVALAVEVLVLALMLSGTIA